MHVGELETDLQRVGDDVPLFKSYDDFYEKAEARLKSIRQDMDDTTLHMSRFLKHTGIKGEKVSLGYALLGMLVAIVAEKECEIMAIDLQFDTKFPGILLRTDDLSHENKKTYERWCSYSKHLRICIDKLAEYIVDIPQYTRYSRRIPDELVKLAYDDKTPGMPT